MKDPLYFDNKWHLIEGTDYLYRIEAKSYQIKDPAGKPYANGEVTNPEHLLGAFKSDVDEIKRISQPLTIN